MVRLLNKMDKTLLLLTLFMFIFGLFMIFDASSMRSFIDFGVSTKYFTKQLIILIGSFIVSIFILKKPTSKYKFYIYPIIGILIFVVFQYYKIHLTYFYICKIKFWFWYSLSPILFVFPERVKFYKHKIFRKILSFVTLLNN